MYKLDIIHELLLAAFSSGEISTLAFDLFQPVYKQISSGMPTSQKIEMILSHASQDEHRIERLLAYIQRANSYQYNRFADKLVQK